MITAVELPAEGFAAHYTYLKLRDRLSYAFALVSVAAALRDATAAGSRRRGWRSAASRTSRGATATAEEHAARQAGRARASFRRAPTTSCATPQGYGHNDFKIDLARRAIVRALAQAAAGTPQTQTDKRIQ